jgi:hypothetical protein
MHHVQSDAADETNAELFSAFSAPKPHNNRVGRAVSLRLLPFGTQTKLSKASCNEFAAAETYPQRFGVYLIF